MPPKTRNRSKLDQLASPFPKNTITGLLDCTSKSFFQDDAACYPQNTAIVAGRYDVVLTSPFLSFLPPDNSQAPFSIPGWSGMVASSVASFRESSTLHPYLKDEVSLLSLSHAQPAHFQ
jgi:hypothetical protein